MAPKPFVQDTLWYMNIIGMNPENLTIFAKARATLTLVLGTIAAVFIFLGMILNYKGILTLFEGSDMLVAILESVIKAAFLQIYQHRIKILLECVQQFWSIDTNAEEPKQEIAAIHKFVGKFRRGMKIIYNITNTSFLAKPIIFRSKTLPINIYEPFDFKISPNYEIVYFLEYLNAMLLLISLLAFDLLFILLITHAVCELKILQYMFANLEINPNVQGDDETCLSNISRLIEHHNFVLGFIKELRNILSVVMLTEFVASMFCICLGLFSLSGEGFPPTPTIAVKYITFLFSYTGEMYFLCYAGNILSEESANVAHAVYKSGWSLKNQPKLRKSLMLVIMRAQNAEKLTVGGMFGLDLNCFTTVINKAFSIFTLMQAMQAEEE